ncbi:MAG: beta-lactamase domain-containing protein [Anaerolineaceae bacterium]|nr:MAG: beta-lactamase domain-containing protein [Anaerolineaceae bacterium]
MKNRQEMFMGASRLSVQDLRGRVNGINFPSHPLTFPRSSIAPMSPRRQSNLPVCAIVMVMPIRILNGFSKSLPWPPYRRIGAVCLLAETNDGLLLVDTGLGLHDYEQPTRMMRDFMTVMRAVRDPDLALVRQIARSGRDPGTVRHIVLSHLHLDHAGGLPDFPQAQVHVARREYETLRHPRKLLEIAYNKADFAHGPRWNLHDLRGETWYGFDAVRLPGIEPQVWLVPLPGHTSGHCGVALQTETGWVFFCGDAAPVNLDFRFGPVALYRPTIGPHVPRLKAFAAAHPEVRLIAGHMFLDFFEKEGTK